MKRVILFAHYDKDNIVDDYVLHLLNGLKPYYDRLIFVTDCPLPAEEKAKIEPFGEIAHAEPHGEYDFGSWKRAFAYLGDQVEDYDEVVIANDSCFGPLYDFGEMFSKMEKRPVDFWGISGTITKKIDEYCINSYFVAFRSNIVKNQAFKDFWPQIVHLDDKLEIVGRYEYGLSNLLHDQGFKSEPYVGWYDTDIMVASSFFSNIWAKKRCPVVKVKMFRENPEEQPHLGRWLEKLSASYPRKYIDDLVKRYIGTTDPAHYHFKYPIFKTYFGHRNLLAFKGRYTKNRKWWRFYIKILGIPLTIFLPARRPEGT